jgi:hypothetical protein
MRPRKLHPVTDDWHRIIDIRVLTKAGAFRQRYGMKFPFQHLETARDHIRVFRVGDKSRQSPQIVAVTWRPMTFGMKPYFICPRCNTRRVYLYFDTLRAYCRACGDLWFRSQQVRRRTRLLHRSHRIRVSFGDQTGKPGDHFPAPRYRQRQSTYRRTIIALRTIEQQYLNIIATDRRYLDRDRDEYGRYLPSETSADDASADELGR